MKIQFIPQRNDLKIEYEFDGERIVVTIDNQTDTFDFSNLPNGILENIETTLPINPILKAEKINSTLHIMLLKYHGANATQEELFPKPLEV